jgi:hypothetical protein
LWLFGEVIKIYILFYDLTCRYWFVSWFEVALLEGGPGIVTALNIRSSEFGGAEVRPIFCGASQQEFAVV